MLIHKLRLHPRVPVVPRRPRHRRRLLEPVDDGRAIEASGSTVRSGERRARPSPLNRAPESGPGPDDRRRPRARSGRQAGQGRRPSNCSASARVVVTRGTWSGSEVLLGRGETDADGRFRIDALRTSSVRYFFVHALVRTPCSAGPSINPDAQQPDGGNPLAARAGHPRQAGRCERPAGRGGRAYDPLTSVESPTSARASTIVLEGARPEGLEAWPEPVKTDDQGRFVFKGLGRGLYVNLAVDDPRYAQQILRIAADDREACRKKSRWRSSPRRRSKGVSLPKTPAYHLPGTVVTVDASRVSADADGRFRANASSGDRFGVACLSAGGSTLSRRRDRGRVDERVGEKAARHQAHARCGHQRQGDGAGDAAGRSRDRASCSCRSMAPPASSRSGTRLSRARRRLVPDRRPTRQGPPARLRPDRRLCP